MVIDRDSRIIIKMVAKILEDMKRINYASDSFEATHVSKEASRATCWTWPLSWLIILGPSLENWLS